MTLILFIMLTIVVGFFNNANSLFHVQEFNNNEISNASKEFIINLFDNVNSVSNEYQNEPSSPINISRNATSGWRSDMEPTRLLIGV